jgi:hypothetical protein
MRDPTSQQQSSNTYIPIPTPRHLHTQRIKELINAQPLRSRSHPGNRAIFINFNS